MGDLSRTVSESLGDFLRKWGIPAIPRPEINTARMEDFSHERSLFPRKDSFEFENIFSTWMNLTFQTCVRKFLLRNTHPSSELRYKTILLGRVLRL